MKVKTNSLSIRHIIKYIIFTAIVVIVSCFFISKKENLFIDEMFTYGLSNNQFMLLENDYQIYSGEEALLNYTAVKNGNQFNFSNVIFNQEQDTHPPIYYLIVNFISSLNVGKFSLWYGLIINVFFMVIIYWGMYYLIFNLLKDEVLALFIPIISMFFYGFINQIVFTRMYVMLTAISLLFIIHIFNYVNGIYLKKNNLKYYIELFFIIVIGALTQYHFFIYLFIISILFLTFLTVKKDYTNAIKYFFTVFISFLFSILLFPMLIHHILGNSQHNILERTEDSILQTLQTMLKNYEQLIFGKSFIWYFIFFILLLLSKIYISKKYKVIFFKKNLFTISIFSLIFTYFFIIVLTIRLAYDRYLFNLMPITVIFLTCLFYNLFEYFNNIEKKKEFILYIFICILITVFSIVIFNIYKINNYIKNVYLLFSIFAVFILLFILIKKNHCSKYLTLFLIFSMTLASHSRNINYMYTNDNMLYNYMTNNRDIRTILVYQKSNIWKLPYPLWILRDMNEIVFVNSDKDNWEKYGTLLNKDKLFVFIYATQNDTMILNKLLSSNNIENVQPILKTSYISGYYLE